MYTQAIGQDSDDVWGLFIDEVMINEKEMRLDVLKQREGVLAKIMMNWNFDVMDFTEIYSENSKAPDNTQDVESNVIGIDNLEDEEE